MTRKLLSILVAVLMVMAIIPMSALASRGDAAKYSSSAQKNPIVDSIDDDYVLPAEGCARIKLTVGDVWQDGTGYQMLLDADATAYGTVFPATGGLTTGGDADEATYAEFEYKIPENADGACDTANIVLNDSVAIEIPAGTYDWCITNPTPGDRIWIASNQGNVGGRADDYEFEEGYTYEFTVSLMGNNDGTDVTITDPTGYTPDPPVPVVGFYFEDEDEFNNDFTIINNDTNTYTWERYQGSAYEGSYCARIHYQYTPSDWLITPAFEVPAVDPTLTFYCKANSSYYVESVNLYVGDEATIDAMELLEEVEVEWTTYQQYTVDLADYAGETIYFAFEYIADDAYYLFLDAVEVWGSDAEEPEDPEEPEPFVPAETLDEALNVTGGELVFTNDATYPWTIVNDEAAGRAYAQSGNAGMASTTSTITTTVTAVEGDIVQFDYKAWGEGSNDSYDWDKCRFSIDGTVVMDYGAHQNDWETFQYALTAGDHTLTWTYKKDSSVNPTGDYFAVDNVYVGQPVPVSAINVQPVEVPAGRRATVVYTVLPDSAYDKSVTFAIEDTAIATVDANGLVTGVAEGTTTITVTSAANPEVSGTATVTVTEALPTVNLFGFDTYDMAGTYDSMWVEFPDYDPTAYVGHGSMSGDAWAAAFAGGNVYGYIYSSTGSGHNFFIMDAETFAVSYTGTNADNVSGVLGMAYNHADDVMYGISGSDPRQLVTINLATGVPAAVAPVSGMDTPVTFAISTDGVAYAIEYGTGDLYTIDLETAAATLVGSTGVACAYVQSMCFDHVTGQLFWAQIYSATEHGLYTVNPTNAQVEYLGMIGPDGGEICGLYTKDELEIAPIEMPDVTVTFVDGLTNETIDTMTVEAGTVLDEADFPEAPEHEGYEFVGWDYDGSAVYSDLTIKARYRDPNATTATVVLSIPSDVWGDGSGYQMLLDADATAYGSIIPESGGLTSGGDAPAGVYDEFEYKIPENADGAMSTQNMLVQGEISIEIPGGVYDWCITNPTPGDRIWIASSNGNIPGRYNDYEFVAGNTYTFTVTFGGQNDQVDLTITEGSNPNPPEPPVTDNLIAGYYFETQAEVNEWTFANGSNADAGTSWVWSENNPGGYDYTVLAHEGSAFIMSYSFIDYDGAYQADNWAISPAVTLLNNSTVSFYATQANASYPDTIEVYVGTTPDYASMTLVQGNICPNTGYDDAWTNYVIDLSAYDGQTIYLAFHHADYDCYEIWVDQVEFFGESGDVPPVGPIWGDADGDGDVDLTDVLDIMRYAQDIIDGADLNLDYMDVNGDGTIDLVDALLVLRYYMELIPELPVGA